MIAFILAVCVGVAAPRWIPADYPALMECFPKHRARQLFWLKRWSLLGEMIYPYCQRLVSQPPYLRVRLHAVVIPVSFSSSSR